MPRTIRNILPLWARRERVLAKLAVISLFFAVCYLSKYPLELDDTWTSLTDYGEIYTEQHSISATAAKWRKCRNFTAFPQPTPNRHRLHSLKSKIKEMMKSVQASTPKSNEKQPGDIAVISGFWEDIHSTSDPLIDSYHKALKALGYFVRLRPDGKRQPHVPPPLPSVNWSEIDTLSQPFAVNLCLQGRCLEKTLRQSQNIATLKISNKIDGMTNALEEINKNETCKIGARTKAFRCFERGEWENLENATRGDEELWSVIQDGLATFVTVPKTSSSVFRQELQKAQNLSAKIFTKLPYLILDRPVRISLFVLVLNLPKLMFFLHQEGVVRIGGLSEYENSQNHETELVWTFSQFQKYLLDTRDIPPHKLWEDLQAAVSEAFSSTGVPSEHLSDGFTDYQVLEVTLHLTTNLEPVVVSVAEHSSLSPNIVPGRILQNALSFLLDQGSVDDEIIDVIAELTANNVAQWEDFHNGLTDNDNLRSAAGLAVQVKANRYGFQMVHSYNSSASESTLLNSNVWSCWEQASSLILDNDFSNFVEDGIKNPGRDCRYDSMFRSLLSSVKLNPAFPLHPSFHPLVSNYQIYVPFHTMSVKMDFIPADCSTDVLMAGDNSSARQATFTVGVGENIISVNVIKRPPTSDVLRTYVFNILRESREKSAVRIDLDSATLQNCSWRQSCSLKLYPNDTCGLEIESDTGDTQNSSIQSSGEPRPDRWILPCLEGCKNELACDWSRAEWVTSGSVIASSGKLEIRNQTRTQSCLEDKKIVFLGDSTNRGIMTELIQRANGTLWADEKIHSVKTYELNLGANHNATLAFGYFPQFWLPERRRPSLTKTLHQILQSIGAVDPAETVFVVGGLQFLRPSHLFELKKALSRRGLEGSKVIIKSFGSGFFLSAPGVKHIEKDKIQQLKQMNDELHQQSKELGFAVVDTFAMTTSRFNEFHTGRCSCHFHSVRSNSVNSITGSKTFTVEGPINAHYTQMVLREICSI